MMKKFVLILAGLSVLAWLSFPELDACTTFCLKDKGGKPVFGRNFDFSAGQGQVQVNLRNQRKTSFPVGTEKPFAWISRFGSLSFNQHGREFPYGGMNEAGLVIAQMMHSNDSARYPDCDERGGLTELQWIQYQLDVSATVADVIASDATVRISNASIAPLHFLAADAGGDVAVIEYLDGKTVVHRGKDLAFAALANDPYDLSLATKARLDAEGVATADCGDRFTQAARLAAAYGEKSGPAVDYAFNVLKTVARAGTRWSIVYDIARRTIHYRTSENPALRRLELERFDFSCAAPRLYLDIDAGANEPGAFQPSDFDSNLRLIDAVWDIVVFLKPLPREARIAWARHADSVVCAQGG
jgi:penicillin V acylase-like amidase (Ntn superfamily)